MASLQDWIEGARIRTLPAAAGPVLLGAGAAGAMGGFSFGKSLLALIVALALQVGVNFANDYSDGIKGTDKARVGPQRLTGSGLAEPKTVLKAALVSFAVAAVAGLALTAWSGVWWFLILGLLAIVAAWFYTGGNSPYGYSGLGISELNVFVFFGLVATVGSTYAQTYSAPLWLWVAASGIGFSSIALLMINNTRDIAGDEKAGKTTVAVRLGDARSRQFVVALLFWAAALAGIAAWGAGIGGFWSFVIFLVFLLIAVPAAGPVLGGAQGKALLAPLRNAGLFTLAYGVILGTVLALGSPAAL